MENLEMVWQLGLFAAFLGVVFFLMRFMLGKMKPHVHKWEEKARDKVNVTVTRYPGKKDKVSAILIIEGCKCGEERAWDVRMNEKTIVKPEYARDWLLRNGWLETDEGPWKKTNLDEADVIKKLYVAAKEMVDDPSGENRMMKLKAAVML